jgi:Skp family chaperone for outer membrane proteins
MPKVWLLVLFLLVPTAARAAEVGYIDLARVVQECADGRKVIAELQANEAARSKAKADYEAAKAAAAKENRPTPAALAQTDQQWQQDQNRKGKQTSDEITARVLRILPAIAKARKLSAVAPRQSMLFVSPAAVDVTAEVVRRIDAGEGRGDDKAAELEAARARVQALERELAPRAKPPAKGK